MRRLVQIQGPIEALDAVIAVGQENLLAYQDYYRDEHFTYSAMLVIYDDAEEGECDVVDQVRTLLAEKGADPTAFRMTQRFLSYPDAMPHEWYVEMERLGGPLLALESLGVRTESQQQEVDRLREEVRYRTAVAREAAEATIEEFMNKIDALLRNK